MSRKMRLPEGMGRSVSISGITVTADAQGHVEIPDTHVEQMRGHGLIDVLDEQRALEIAASQAQKAEPEEEPKSSRPRIRKTATQT